MDAGQSLPLSLRAALDFDFEMSDLPYKVDVVDGQTISESFKALIEKDRMLLFTQEK